MDRPKPTIVVLEVVVVAAYVWYCWSIYRISKAEGADTELGSIYMRAAHWCFGVAEKFGQWGIKYEMKAIDEFETGRMI